MARQLTKAQEAKIRSEARKCVSEYMNGCMVTNVAKALITERPPRMPKTSWNHPDYWTIREQYHKENDAYWAQVQPLRNEAAELLMAEVVGQLKERFGKAKAAARAKAARQKAKVKK